MVRRPVAPTFAFLAALCWSAVASVSCSQPTPRLPEATTGAAHGALRVLMIDGGGRREQNYQSHLLHVRALRDLLQRAGVPDARIDIFSSDGSDPAEDLAVRDVQPEADFWLLEGTRLDGPLRTPVVYANSTVDGATLQPATNKALSQWFRTARKQLHRGDTLLLYVTDHGTKNADDLRNNKIVLWGKDEHLSVSGLRELLAQLDPGVRVVMLMSQCYSGAFAHLATPERANALPRGNVCGYFASTADRPAYGCYPENRGRANVGHSFHFIDQLGRTGSLDTAHLDVLVSDASPDVPFRTSDQYLDDLLHRVAGKGDFTETVDTWLQRAWEHRADWESDLRLLDAIGHAFGYFSPRSLSEFQQQAKDLPDLSDSLRQQSRAWKEALASLNSARLDRLTAGDPAWAARLDEKAVAALTPETARPLAVDVLAALRTLSKQDPARAKRLKTLRQRSEVASMLSYRMEVRLGVVLRMRALLTSIAGRAYLAAAGTPAERAAYDQVRNCETLSLPMPPDDTPALEAAAAFPRFEDDLALAETTLPAWMGIQFKPSTKEDQTDRNLPSGAAMIAAVYPDSPAQAAGIEAADVILGPPGAPFSEPSQVREWIMLSAVDVPRDLEILRGDEHKRVTLVPKPYPRKWPALPSPPKVGSAAPPLHLSPYRNQVPTDLADGKPHLLFFWATWCGICKAAVPELLAFEQERGAQVIAVTDETAKQLDPFFQSWSKPFPDLVATDAYRRDFVAYGVSGTPTFVLIDGNGVVTEYVTGYKATTGLPFKGWKWKDRPAK